MADQQPLRAAQEPRHDCSVELKEIIEKQHVHDAGNHAHRPKGPIPAGDSAGESSKTAGHRRNRPPEHGQRGHKPCIPEAIADHRRVEQQRLGGYRGLHGQPDEPG